MSGHRPKQHGLGKRGSFCVSIVCMGPYYCCMDSYHWAQWHQARVASQSLRPHLQKHKVHRLPFNLFPLRCLQKKTCFVQKTSIGVRGSFSLHGNHWYGSGMAVTVADITVSFRCRCANGDDCDDDIWPTYTEFVPPSVVYVCRDTCCFGLRP